MFHTILKAKLFILPLYLVVFFSFATETTKAQPDNVQKGAAKSPTFDQTRSNPPPADTTYAEPQVEHDTPIRTIQENMLGILLLLLGSVTVIMEMRLIKARQFSDDSAIKLIIITLVIFGSIFLIVAGYFSERLAPAFGLLGTISGYLLGKTDFPKSNSDNTK